jgi:hypothetical protein
VKQVPIKLSGWQGRLSKRSIVIPSLISIVIFLGLGIYLRSNFAPVDGNYLPSPIANIIDQYHKANPVIKFPRNYENLCARPQNPVVAENCRQGTEDWVIRKNSSDILGFASSTSINKGESIQFYIDTSSPQFNLSIFRLGYYLGKGGRLIESFPDIPGDKQPPCNINYHTGLTSCSNWNSTFVLNVPVDWVSGIYLAKMVQKDSGGENYILFVVRDDDSRSDILYQQSVATSQAYNNFGGKSLYTNNSTDCNTVSGAYRAVEVSFDRPYNAPMGDPSTFFKAEYPMVRWLEAQGYWVTYSTDLDTHHSGLQGAHNGLLDHKVFLSVGHDEYWSREMRESVIAARDAGVNIGIFSGNTSFWSVRFAPDPWSGKADRTMVAYNTTETGVPDPSGIPTTSWRDPEGEAQPENALFGIQYLGDNETNYFPLRVYAGEVTDPLFLNTGLEQLPAGSYVDIGKSLVGWEWDGFVDNGAAPKGVTTLFNTPVVGEILQDAGSNFTLGKANVETAYYQAPSGSIVFASGTIQWSWGLDLYEPDVRIQQVTYNVFERMGVQPATPGPDLVVNGRQEGPPKKLTPKYPTSPPAITDITVDFSQEGRVIISWQTDKPSTSQIWYWIADSNGYFDDQSVWIYPSNNSSSDLVQSHQVDLLDLKPGLEYHFELVSQDREGNSTLSSAQIFDVPQTGTIDRLASGFQPVMSDIICTAKPYVLPGLNWIRQINGWIVSGFISILIMLLGIWRLNYHRSF